MNTFDEAKSIRDLCEYYCFRCSVGLTDCKISAVECNKIRQDRDFESVTKAEEIVAEQTEPTTEDCSMVAKDINVPNKTEPSTYTTYTAYGCSYGKWRTEDEKTCYNCLHYMNGVGCQNREMYHTDCPWK